MVASRFWMSRRAMIARRWPLKTSGSSCVSRIRINASSAATKKPLVTTSASTPSTRNKLAVSTSMLQTHLPENHFENILQTDDSNLTLISSEHNGQTLAAALHPFQRRLQPQVLLHIDGGLEIVSGGFGRIEVGTVQQGCQTHDARNRPAFFLLPPYRQPGCFLLPRQLEHLAHGRPGRDGGHIFHRHRDLAHGDVLQ